MISFSFLFFFVFFFISQATCIGGGSWFEGKRSPEKRSNQCGPGWQISFYDNETSDDCFAFWKKEVFNVELDGTVKAVVVLKN